MPYRTRLVAVGACAIDTILNVPHFPAEDSKLRATSLQKRRGGNSANTLEVLQQLINHDSDAYRITKPNGVELCLIAALPSRSCASTAYLGASFDTEADGDARWAKLDLEHAVFREDHTEPVSCYVVSSESTSSRTIINHNALPEMTFEEFVSRCDRVLELSILPGYKQVEQLWFHFEGRIPGTVLECIRYLRGRAAFQCDETTGKAQLDLMISVELEKPGREGLQDLANEADVVFYSRSWAEAKGYKNAADCLSEQYNLYRPLVRRSSGRERLLVCTWGAEGACGMTHRRYVQGSSHVRRKSAQVYSPTIINSSAYERRHRPVLDTTGAGDTFIAGVLFGLICRSAEHSNLSHEDARTHLEIAVKSETDLKPEPELIWTLEKTLEFANVVAGRKVIQQGFQGLGKSTTDIKDHMDYGCSVDDDC